MELKQYYSRLKANSYGWMALNLILFVIISFLLDSASLIVLGENANYINKPIETTAKTSLRTGHMTKIDETYSHGSHVPNEYHQQKDKSDISFKNNNIIYYNNVNKNQVLSEIQTRKRNHFHIKNVSMDAAEFANKIHHDPKANRYQIADSSMKKSSKLKAMNKARITNGNLHHLEAWNTFKRSRQWSGVDRTASLTAWKAFFERQNQNQLCNDVLCEMDEYCFVPEVGVAECLKMPMNLQTIEKEDKSYSISLDRNNNNKNNNKKMKNGPMNSVLDKTYNNNDLDEQPNEQHDDQADYDNLMADFGQYIDYDDDLDDDDDNDDGDDDEEDEDDEDDDEDMVKYEQYNHKNKKNKRKIKTNHHPKGDITKLNKRISKEMLKSSKLDGNHRSQSRSNNNNRNRNHHQKIKENRPFNQIKNVDHHQIYPTIVEYHRKQQQQQEQPKIIHCPSCPFTHGQIICATDNITYSSMCRIEFHNCIHSTNVKFACFGFCPCTKVFNQQFSNNNQLNHHHLNLNNYHHHKSFKTNGSTKKKHKQQQQQQQQPEQEFYIDVDDDLLSDYNQKNTEIKLIKNSSSDDSILTKEALNQYHYDVVQQKPTNSNQRNTKFDNNNNNKINNNNNNNLKQNNSECSTEDLRSMGFRLLDWFTVVMKEELKRKAHLTTTNKLNNNMANLARNKTMRLDVESKTLNVSSSIRKYVPDCEEQVSFMFYHFDIDRNYKLSNDELYYLEHDENEHCLQPYLTQCDEDGNDLLSAYEWCSCFSLRSKPCLFHQKHIVKHNAILVGQYVPQCDEKGHYKNVQCQSSNGFCWCSDKNGNEIAGTRIRGRLPICDKNYPLNLNRFQQHQIKKEHQIMLGSKHKPIVSKQKQEYSSPYVDIEINEDDDDDDDDDDNSFSMDHGSGFESF